MSAHCQHAANDHRDTRFSLLFQSLEGANVFGCAELSFCRLVQLHHLLDIHIHLKYNFTSTKLPLLFGKVEILIINALFLFYPLACCFEMNSAQSEVSLYAIFISVLTCKTYDVTCHWYQIGFCPMTVRYFFEIFQVQLPSLSSVIKIKKKITPPESVVQQWTLAKLSLFLTSALLAKGLWGVVFPWVRCTNCGLMASCYSLEW